jgi:hypothetical protein
MKKAQTTNLFNERVVSVTPVSRNIAPSAGSGSFGIPHVGVLAKTESGHEYLIHHG